MVQDDLGAATIVYEGPDGEPVELTVENEHVAYFQDHWVVKLDDEERTPEESGADTGGSGDGATDESAGGAAGDVDEGAESGKEGGSADEVGGGADDLETGPEESGVEPDTIRRIPAARVYHVERDVETFEEEVGTRLDDVQSVAESLEDELRSRVESVAGGVPTGLFGGRDRPTGEVQRIEVETGGEDGEESGDEAGEQERPTS